MDRPLLISPLIWSASLQLTFVILYQTHKQTTKQTNQINNQTHKHSPSHPQPVSAPAAPPRRPRPLQQPPLRVASSILPLLAHSHSIAPYPQSPTPSYPNPRHSSCAARLSPPSATRKIPTPSHPATPPLQQRAAVSLQSSSRRPRLGALLPPAQVSHT